MWKARSLSSELTNSGATLYDLLTNELTNKEIRTTHGNRPMELALIERSLKYAIISLQNNIQLKRNKLDQSKTDKNNLNSKVQRKVADLERKQQRLEALQKVKPAYLQEFEFLEKDLSRLCLEYMTRIRCFDAFKAQLNSRANTKGQDVPVNRPKENSLTIFPEGNVIS